MVKPELLAENPNWIEENRVYANGAAWSDNEPKVHTKGKSKHAKIQAAMAPAIQNAQKGNDKLQRAKAAFENHQQAQAGPANEE